MILFCIVGCESSDSARGTGSSTVVWGPGPHEFTPGKRACRVSVQEGRRNRGQWDADGDLIWGKIAENGPKKLEAGRSAREWKIPETDCPLDPEPGLGGMFSLGLL
jgi:hypothetical protein